MKEQLESIQIRYTDRAVHVLTDENLAAYLNGECKDDARRLADYILVEYEQRFLKPLCITRDSLAVEILVHVFADRLTKRLLEKDSVLPESIRNVLEPVLKKIERSTSVIDCGEREVDNNRFVFDALAPCCGLISEILE